MPARWNFPSSKRPNLKKNLIWAVYVGRRRRTPWLDEFSAWRQSRLFRGGIVRKHASGSTRRQRSSAASIPVSSIPPIQLLPIVPSTMRIIVNGRVLSEEELQEIVNELNF
jgi:hypothetical protein